MRKIRQEDEVIVLTGKDKGKRGKVVRLVDDSRVCSVRRVRGTGIQ